MKLKIYGLNTSKFLKIIVTLMGTRPPQLLNDFAHRNSLNLRLKLAENEIFENVFRRLCPLRLNLREEIILHRQFVRKLSLQLCDEIFLGSESPGFFYLLPLQEIQSLLRFRLHGIGNWDFSGSKFPKKNRESHGMR